jgi:hypothetical protein
MVTSMSVFAESRHRDDTSSRQARRSDAQVSREQSSRSSNDRSDRSDRSTTQSSRDNSSAYRNNSSSSYHNNNNSYRNNNNSYHSDGRRGYATYGHVTRIAPYHGGYQVWLGGGYPFFVSSAWYHSHHLAVGLNINLGGYWNPAGYYDQYDGYYNTQGELRGIVESVDYRRGTAVVRDDLSGSFVTIAMRGRDSRLGNLRQGDFVTLGGEWSRNGVFSAYNVLDQQYAGRDYGRDGRY